MKREFLVKLHIIPTYKLINIVNSGAQKVIDNMIWAVIYYGVAYMEWDDEGILQFASTATAIYFFLYQDEENHDQYS